jgi:transcriptional regulator with XRE-family HTH domain
MKPTPLRFRFDKAGRTLKMARETAGLSQLDVGRKMGGDQAHVSRIEAGADVRISTLANAARVLGYEMMLVPLSLVPVVEALAKGKTDEVNRPRYTLDSEDGEEEKGEE